MTFLVWRQYRTQWAIALAVLAAFAVVELANGIHMASAWHSLVNACASVPVAQRGQGGQGGGCLNQDIVGLVGNDLRILSVMVPAILGILWGAPLIAHELESGTTGFVLTQGITRNRWLAAKVGLLLLAAALWAGVISALVTWWSGPENAQRADAFQPNYFDTQGITPIGYALFAMALGIAAGAVLRRTIPAIAVTLAGFIGFRLFFNDIVRQHLMPAVTTVTSMTSTWSPGGISWVLNAGLLNASGQVPNVSGQFSSYIIDGVPASQLPAACQPLAASPNQAPALSCLSKAGYHQFVMYQPGSRYWDFQGIETGIYVLVAALLLTVAWYVIRRRDA
jgi:ABC-type transport system involved in multi-copper enzyme maturation permease subunit